MVGNAGLLTKVYFPRLIIPSSTMIVCLIDLLISFLILIGLMAAYRFMPDVRVLLLPVFVLLALISSLGAGLLVAALNVKFRDFRFVVPFLLQLGLYVSPVAFSSHVRGERENMVWTANKD